MILRDEGVGIHVVKELEKNYRFPQNVDILDGATGGYFLLNDVAEYKHVIMIDAATDNLPAGSVRLIRPRFSSDYPAMMSAHEFGLKQMIDAMLFLEKMPDMYLIVVSVKDFQQLGLELSEEVRESIPKVIAQIISLVEQIIPEYHERKDHILASSTMGVVGA
jgi:hydrogenase maturation protease